MSEWLWCKLVTSSHASLEVPYLETDMAAQQELNTAPSPSSTPPGSFVPVGCLHINVCPCDPVKILVNEIV